MKRRGYRANGKKKSKKSKRESDFELALTAVLKLLVLLGLTTAYPLLALRGPSPGLAYATLVTIVVLMGEGPALTNVLNALTRLVREIRRLMRTMPGSDNEPPDDEDT
jgi:hypothetical protein